MPTSDYGPTTTAAEVVADVDLHGRRAIVPARVRGSVPRPPGRWPRRAPM